MEILDQWLRNFPGSPTWHDVSDALRKIGLQQLASDIEKVYETGNIKVNFCNPDPDPIGYIIMPKTAIPSQSDYISHKLLTCCYIVKNLE